VAELLDRAVGRLDEDFADDSVTKGRLLDALGQTYDSLGLFLKAAEIHKRALAVRQAYLGHSPFGCTVALTTARSGPRPAGS
jgi:hypothetical protein